MQKSWRLPVFAAALNLSLGLGVAGILWAIIVAAAGGCDEWTVAWG